MFDEAGVGVNNLKSILEESTEAGKLLHGQIMKEIIHKDVGQIDTALIQLEWVWFMESFLNK